ncbi:unnamed protein product, partial [marine sediment metagenome]
GLRIDVRGFNSTTQTQCNGTIQVLTVEACHIYNKTSVLRYIILADPLRRVGLGFMIISKSKS